MWKMDKYLPHVNSLRKLGLSNLLGTCFRIGLHFPLHLQFKKSLERRSRGAARRKRQSWACLLARPGVPMKWRWIKLEVRAIIQISCQWTITWSSWTSKTLGSVTKKEQDQNLTGDLPTYLSPSIHSESSVISDTQLMSRQQLDKAPELSL